MQRFSALMLLVFLSTYIFIFFLRFDYVLFNPF